MHRSRACLALLLSSGLIASSARSAPAGSVPPAPPAPAGLVEHVTSELVLIETYVSDPSGHPIRGLVADDFVLQVDGRRRPIASVEFREAQMEDGVAPQSGGVAPSLAPALSPPRRFVLFFEDGTSAPQGLLAARKAAQRFLSSMSSSDQIALAAYDRRMRILHDFTTDRESLRRTIDGSLADSRRMSDFAAEIASHEDEFRRALAIRNFDLAQTLATTFASEETPRLRDVLKALRTLVDSLSTWRGYKGIIFMGDGIPENPALPYLELMETIRLPDLPDVSQRVTLSQEIRELSEAAAAAGVTLHTIQTAGLTAGRANQERASYRRQNSLETLALNTGGTSSSSNDLARALAEAEESSRAYYVLGYAPEGPPDGLYHTVQVHCRRSGMRVRWRRGFTRLLPADAYARTVQAAYLLPELYPGLSLDLLAVEGPRDPSGRVTDLILHIPTDRLLFAPEEGSTTAVLEVGIVSLDDALRETFRTAQRLHIGLPARSARKPPAGVNLYVRVRLPPQSQSISATVADRNAGVVGAARLALPPEGPSGGRIAGLSIYSLAEESAWIDLSREAGARDPAAPIEFTLGPALRGSFEIGEPLACGFRIVGRTEGRNPALKVVIRRGETVLKSLDVAPGAVDQTVKMALPLDDLAAGEYMLAVQEILPDRQVDRATSSFHLVAAAGTPP